MLCGNTVTATGVGSQVFSRFRDGRPAVRLVLEKKADLFFIGFWITVYIYNLESHFVPRQLATGTFSA